MLKALGDWFDATILDLGRQLRLSYLPPLMVYLAAGISGLTAIVGTFFIKDYLGLSAAFLAGLGFWAGIPWALKMPLGHLVDLIWRRKFLLVYLGAALIALSIAIMYGLIAHTAAMASFMADRGLVRAERAAGAGRLRRPGRGRGCHDRRGGAGARRAAAGPIPSAEIKPMHTTMQTLGRVAMIGGLVLVAVLNISMFAGVETMSEAEKTEVYAQIYLMALVIPALSIMGVILGGILLRRRARRLRAQGVEQARIDALFQPAEKTTPELVDLRRQPRVRRLHPDHGAGPGAVRPGDRLPGLDGDRRVPDPSPAARARSQRSAAPWSAPR